MATAFLSSTGATFTRRPSAALKTKWGKSKCIIEELSKYADDASFWRQFGTEKGERLCYRQILNLVDTKIVYDHR
ncbi:hypothetical protein JVT61DRAFT_10972 [Boletus reticuloceps]|uniref:Uncharacterized protein n=1 Tax=Boletus reticuloceps TaxID=495285 RepID=A0A8I2YF69_9AGAM|nr:hypothetical protein JVT61DRAFT_10972 [Boletus reticuloceps]